MGLKNTGTIKNFLKSTKTISPTGDSGATSLPPVGDGFMYIKTSSTNGYNNVFVSFERTDIFQIRNITLHYNRFSILTNDLLKSMGRFKSQLLLEDHTWSTRYNIPKNGRCCDSSTQWTKLSFIFNVDNYGVRLIYDQVGTPHADMCFSKIIILHSS